jgi:phosphoribosylformylglycinamidine synthase
VLDPQGKAIEGALRSLGIEGVASVRQGKLFDIEVDGADRAGVAAVLDAAAKRLLANPVIENFQVAIEEAESPLPPEPQLPPAVGLEAFSPDGPVRAGEPTEPAALHAARPTEGHP